MQSLDKRGIDSIPVDRSSELQSISGILSSFENELEKSPGNVLLKDL